MHLRIHARILLSFETASDLILEALGDVEMIKIAFPSRRDFLFGRETHTFLLTYNKC